MANTAGGGAELSYAPADLHGLGVVGPEELEAVVGSGSVSSVLAHVEDCKHRRTIRHQGAPRHNVLKGSSILTGCPKRLAESRSKSPTGGSVWKFEDSIFGHVGGTGGEQ